MSRSQFHDEARRFVAKYHEWELRAVKDALGEPCDVLRCRRDVEVGDSVAVFSFFVIFSEEYRLPVIYFAADWVAAADDEPASLTSTELQKVLPNADCCAVEQPAALPLVSKVYCELLGRVLYHVHPCDVQIVVQELTHCPHQTTIEQVLALVGPSIGLPFCTA